MSKTHFSLGVDLTSKSSHRCEERLGVIWHYAEKDFRTTNYLMQERRHVRQTKTKRVERERENHLRSDWRKKWVGKKSVEIRNSNMTDLLLRRNGGVSLCSLLAFVVVLSLNDISVKSECIKIRNLPSDPSPGDIYQLGVENFTITRYAAGIIQSPEFPDPMSEDPTICRWLIEGENGEFLFPHRFFSAKMCSVISRLFFFVRQGDRH